jgi:uncharacterized protein with HEPN domain
MLERDMQRLEVILKKIVMIEEIVESFGFVSKALEDEKLAKPAIMMHLTAIAEQFSKLKDKSIIERFDENDIKGAVATRNFIAHDYDGVNLGFIEVVIRERLPVIKAVIEKVLND